MEPTRVIKSAERGRKLGVGATVCTKAWSCQTNPGIWTVVRCELQVGVARNECRRSWGHFLEGFLSQAGELEDPWIHVN